MDKLVVCQVCRRHVKEHDARCPFCHNTATPRAGIAIVGAVAVGVGLSFAACGGQVTIGDAGVDSGSDADGGPVPMYGPPPWWDGSVPADSGADADGGMVVAYGPPPPQDSGQD